MVGLRAAEHEVSVFRSGSKFRLPPVGQTRPMGHQRAYPVACYSYRRNTIGFASLSLVDGFCVIHSSLRRRASSGEVIGEARCERWQGIEDSMLAGRRCPGGCDANGCGGRVLNIIVTG